MDSKRLKLAKEALESGSYDKETIEYIFPELKENEDEKIAKELIRYLPYCDDIAKDTKERWIAWLEKQGNNSTSTKEMNDPINEEQKDFFKFHIGDWIVTNDKKEVFFIKNISLGYLSLEDVEGVTHYPCLPLDSKFHHWTIEDAKDGDVLADDDSITIFRKIGNDIWNDVIDFYACYNFRSDKIIIQKDILHCGTIKSKFIKPATKEQRDLLFQKMNEEGYEWDSENKVLKKI